MLYVKGLFFSSVTVHVAFFSNSGDVFVKLRDRDDQGWCTGCKDGHIGLYPDNYVQVVGPPGPGGTDRP